MELDSDGVAAVFPPMQERGASRWRAGGRLVLVHASSERPVELPAGDCWFRREEPSRAPRLLIVPSGRELQCPKRTLDPPAQREFLGTGAKNSSGSASASGTNCWALEDFLDVHEADPGGRRSSRAGRRRGLPGEAAADYGRPEMLWTITNPVTVDCGSVDVALDAFYTLRPCRLGSRRPAWPAGGPRRPRHRGRRRSVRVARLSVRVRGRVAVRVSGCLRCPRLR